MTLPPIPNWNQYFMLKAYAAATKSKDRSTHVGAVVIGPDNEVRTSGYNSFPRNLNDNVEARYERPLKYMWTEHAERNAIYNAARTGVALKDCDMYCMWFPCHECARAILGSGIKKVIYHKEFQDAFTENPLWDESHTIAQEMFLEAGVEVIEWSGVLVPIIPFKSGKRVNLFGEGNGISGT